MRIRLILLVAAATIAALVYGGDMLLKGFKFRQARVLTYDQFVAEKPTEGWFRITNGILNVADETHVLEKGHENNLDEVKQAYIPIVSPDKDGPDANTTHVLVLTSDPAIIGTIHEVGAEGAALDDKAKAEAFVEKNRSRLYVSRDVEGTLKSGLGSEASDNVRELQKANPESLAPDFVVLEEGAKPSMLNGAALFVLGLALAGGQVVFYTRGMLQRR